MSYSAFMTYIKLGLNDAVLSGIQEERARELNVQANTSARELVMSQWPWKNPAPQNFQHFTSSSGVIVGTGMNLSAGSYLKYRTHLLAQQHMHSSVENVQAESSRQMFDGDTLGLATTFGGARAAQHFLSTYPSPWVFYNAPTNSLPVYDREGDAEPSDLIALNFTTADLEENLVGLDLGTSIVNEGANVSYPRELESANMQPSTPVRESILASSSRVFDLPGYQSSASNHSSVPARMVRIDGVMKLVVDLPTMFESREPLQDPPRDAVSGLAKWSFGRFSNISDVVRLFEEEGLGEASNLDQPARMKKSNARMMYDEWLRLGSVQTVWDAKFSSAAGRIWPKSQIIKVIREEILVRARQ
jgi:hypothetical protein